MKRIFSILLCLLLAACLLVGCGGKTEPSVVESDPAVENVPETEPENEPAEVEMNLADAVNAVNAVANVKEPLVLSPADAGSEDYLTDLYGLDLTVIEDYYGLTTQISTYSDVVLLVKASAGNAAAVRDALEASRTNLANTFQMYDDVEYTKADNGLVVSTGDYVLLAIAGDPDRIAAGETDAVYTEIAEAVDAALR